MATLLIMWLYRYNKIEKWQLRTKAHKFENLMFLCLRAKKQVLDQWTELRSNLLLQPPTSILGWMKCSLRVVVCPWLKINNCLQSMFAIVIINISWFQSCCLRFKHFCYMGKYMTFFLLMYIKALLFKIGASKAVLHIRNISLMIIFH